MLIKLTNLDLNQKIFFTTLAVILSISVIIAFLARWILVSSLTDELYHRGEAIGHSIAERARGYILDDNKPQLVTLAFDAAYLGDRKTLVSYIFISDSENHVLANTLTSPFPEQLARANLIPPDKDSSIRLLHIMETPTLDIAVPINEGIYRIGAVHVGLDKARIDALVSKLRTTFLGFIALVSIIIFYISYRLANYISGPVTRLTRISDELSKGNFDIDPELEGMDGWSPTNCPAYENTDLPCWHFDQTLGNESSLLGKPENRSCSRCMFYAESSGDEVTRLAASFRNMVWSIRLYRRKIKESELKYRSLFASGPDPILVVNQQSLQILDANPRVEETYGYTRQELKDLSYNTIQPDFETSTLKTFESPFESGQCVYLPKVIQYRKNGEPFYVNLHACPISYKGSLAIIIAANDITELMEKDAQLIQASKMKTLGEMSAGIAHELNQPLNAIKMGSDFLTMLADSDGEIPLFHLHQVSEEISVQVDRATEIINTLRAFSRKTEMGRERVNLNNTIRGVLRIIGQQLRLSNITIALDLEESIPPVSAHDNRLQQVLFNLISNARDAIISQHDNGTLVDDRASAHSPQKEFHGRILLSTLFQEGNVTLRIEDNGTGISQETQERIFEPFYTTKEIGQGMGLGLSISYGIIKDYKGEIRIDSEPGKGAVFYLSFPPAASDLPRQGAR